MAAVDPSVQGMCILVAVEWGRGSRSLSTLAEVASRNERSRGTMDTKERETLLIKLAYWLGIGADALWAVALFIPAVYGALTGISDFNPDTDTRNIMVIGGTLMTAWTLLLVWALRDPIQRRGVILLTAFPIVFILTAMSLINVIDGDTFQLWIVVKGVALIASMVASYRLAQRRESEAQLAASK